jgi:hypothetical protein
MSDIKASDDLAAFVRENRELITRLLAHGDAEAPRVRPRGPREQRDC